MKIKNKAYTLLGVLFIILCILSFNQMQNIWMIIPGLICGGLFLRFGIQLKDKPIKDDND